MNDLKRSVYGKIIGAIASFGVLVSIWLVYTQFKTANFCPDIFLQIPACYAVLTSFILVLASIFITRKVMARVIFIIGASAGLTLAVWFSASQILGTKTCPQAFGVPLCFVSLTVFTMLIILYILKLADENKK